MIIDLMGSKTYTEYELRYIAQDEIASRWNNAERANVQSKIEGVALKVYAPTQDDLDDIERYKNDLVEIKTTTAQAILDNQLLIDTLAYEAAITRLTRYQLSVGRPEQTIYADDGITIEAVIPATTSEPLTIQTEIYDENGVASVIEIDNPAIAQDEQERSEAQNIISTASQSVIDLYNLRTQG